MASKLIFFALLAVLVLASVHGEDDFKEVDDVEDEIEKEKIEDDEEFEARLPRLFRSGGRFGGGRIGGRLGGRIGSRNGIRTGSRLGGTRFGRFGRTRTGTSTRGSFRFGTRTSRNLGGRAATRTGGGIRVFRRATTGGTRTGGGIRLIRRNTAGRTGSGGIRIFRRNSAGGTGSGIRIFRRSTTGGTRSGGVRIFRRSSSGGTRTGTRLFRRTRQSRQTTSGTGGTGGTGGGGGPGIWGKIGTVVSILSLATDITKTTLGMLANVEKKIVVSIGNLEGVAWEGNTVYMNEGSNVKALPPTVAVTEGILIGGEKKPGSSATGVSGVACYRMQDVSKSFCLMYKVPWSGDNYWNIKIYDGNKPASSDVYNELQNGAMKAGTPISRKDLAQGNIGVTDSAGNQQERTYKIYLKDASMTNAGGATLQLSLGVEISGIPPAKVDDERKIDITLQNADGVDWQGGTIYMNEGADDELPASVVTGDGYEMTRVQKDGEAKKGVSGAICYHLSDISKSFCLMFKVPYDVNNKWNVKVYDGEVQASADVYNDLQDDAIDGGNAIDRRVLYQGEVQGTSYNVYMAQCNMSNAAKSALQVSVGVELA